MNEDNIDFTRCPVCGSDNIVMYDSEPFVDDVIISCSCEKCHSDFRFISRVTGVLDVGKVKSDKDILEKNFRMLRVRDKLNELL